jgi:hypothetical protein
MSLQPRLILLCGLWLL